MTGNTAKELLKALEERAKEIEALKKELQKCERERNQLETQKHSFDDKQPTNVQLLLSQKRELQMQLEREESEKHELFSQINQLIGDVDDLKNKQDSAASNQAQLQELSLENEQLKKDFGRKEMAFQKVSEELLRLQSELERRERTHKLEKNRLCEEVQDCQREIEVKSAALQSLSLAKQSSHDSTKLASENNALRQELQEKEDLLRELTESNDELGQSLTESGAQMDALNRQINQLENSLEQQVHQMESQSQDFIKQRHDMESEMISLRQKIRIAENSSEELTHKVEEMQKENEKSILNDGMSEEDLGTLMNSFKKAKGQLAAKDAEIAGLRQQCSSLKVETDVLVKRSNNFDEKACEKCFLKKNQLRNLNSELALLRQTTGEQKDFSTLIKQLEAEKEELFTHLQSKTERLEKVEELVLRLESSLKLIESESAKSKVLEMERLHQIQALNQQLAEVEQSFSISKDALSLNAAKEAAIVKKLKMDLENERLLVAEKSQQLLDIQNIEEKNQILLKRIMNALEVEHVGSIEEDQENLIVHKLIGYKEQSQGLQKHLAELDGIKKKSATETASMSRLMTELREAEEQNRKLMDEIHEIRLKHSEEQKTMQDEMVENVGRLSGLLESENKRQSAVKQEKEHWHEEANKLVQQKTELEKKVEELENKLVQLQNRRSLLQRQHSNTSSSDGGDPDEQGSLKSKVSKLMDENARLAGDLLKLQTGMEQEFRRVLHQEKQVWSEEKKALETKLKQSEQHLQEQMANTQRSDSAEPVPKPRKLTLNGGDSESLSAALINSSEAINSESLSDKCGAEITKLKAELDKQKRLVTVLRKKLQQQNIEATLKSRVDSMSDSVVVAGGNSGATTLPRRL